LYCKRGHIGDILAALMAFDPGLRFQLSAVSYQLSAIPEMTLTGRRNYMGLFDQPEEEIAASSDEIEFDKDSKIRLFETQKRESDEARGYFKKFLPVAVVAILIIGGMIYFMQPGIGSAVKPPKAIEDSVYNYMLNTEHRSVREITFYNCDGWYWVKILAEPRTALASVDDPTNQYRLQVDRDDDTVSNIQTLTVQSKENDKPCPRRPNIVGRSFP
jgi:hypothetical protein